jgi:hypothetical protein
VLYL